MHRILRSGALCVLLSLHGGAADAQAPPPAAPAGAIRVFLDCSFYCDQNYLRQEITVIDYMRDRSDADVHVLVTTQSTGGGGTEFSVQFIGLGRFAGVDQTLKYVAPQASTPDETRRGIADVLKLGLVRYVSETPQASKVRVTFGAASAAAGGPDMTKDPWNLWVFRTNVGGSFNGEQSNRSRSLRGSASANRTTDRWRIGVSASTNYRENSFQLETNVFKSVNRNTDASAQVVRSLSDHWSAGLVATVGSSSFLNYDMRTRVAPGLEYNFFPYSQSTRRMLTVQYTVGADRHDYRAETIYGKTKESLVDHQIETGLSLRQPWGTASGSVDVSQYLTAPGKYSISAFGSASVRLFKGFSFNVFTNLSRTRDQIYLPRGTATTEEILVRQRQLATGYRYFVNFGISYSFGSIFNNIVNPRFGGGGGGGNMIFFE